MSPRHWRPSPPWASNAFPLSEEQPIAFARLRATTKLKLPDCCVLAAALETGATLATVDATLARVATEHGVTVTR